MKIVSLHVGRPENREWKGRTLFTAIFKDSVSGPLKCSEIGLEGDGQGDKKHHGGHSKALYTYAHENYAYWKELRGESHPLGVFGENIVTEGLDESEVCVGDQFRMGSVVAEATEPRIPCSRLGLRFGDDGVIKQFMNSQRPGIYWQVIEPGDIGVNDSIRLLKKDPNAFRVHELFEMKRVKPDPERLKAWLQFDKLESGWREWMEKKLAS